MPRSQSSNPTKDERTALRTPDQASPAPRWRAVALPAVLILITGAVLFAKTRHYGLIGWDAYPLIATSRILSLDDLAATFSEPLMAGRFPALFYRPVVNLSFALDYALGGLRPWVYQLTNLVLFCGCAAFIGLLVSRLSGKGARWAGLIALLVFLLNPTHWEVIPVPARRAEMLCAMFIAWSLWSQASSASLSLRRPAIRPALLCLLALASKETAIILPGLAFLTVWWWSPRGSAMRRLTHALLAVVPHLLAVGIWIASRYAVLGGVRGKRTIDLDRLDATVGRQILEGLAFPQPAIGESVLGLWLAGLAGGFVVLALLLRMLRSRRGADAAENGTDRRTLSTAAVAVAMLLSLLVIYSIAADMRSWYLFLPVMAVSMLVGTIGDDLLFSMRRGRAGVRVFAAVSLLLLGTFFGWQARYSPLLYDYDEWDRATAASDVFFNELRTRIDQADNGSTIETPLLPRWVRPRSDAAGVRGGQTLDYYTVQAWADLVIPDRRVRILRATGRNRNPPPADPDELVVRLIGNRTDF